LILCPSNAGRTNRQTSITVEWGGVTVDPESRIRRHIPSFGVIASCGRSGRLAAPTNIDPANAITDVRTEIQPAVELTAWHEQRASRRYRRPTDG